MTFPHNFKTAATLREVVGFLDAPSAEELESVILWYIGPGPRRSRSLSMAESCPVARYMRAITGLPINIGIWDAAYDDPMMSAHAPLPSAAVTLVERIDQGGTVHWYGES